MLPLSGNLDVTLRIEHLPSSHLSNLLSVSPTDTAKRVKTLFARYKYRQLPVLADPSTLIGAVTQESVLSADVSGRTPTLAGITRPAAAVAVDEEVRKAFPPDSRHRFVFVRDTAGVISGVVTLSDVHEARQKLTGPYLLIGEIELRLRKILSHIYPSVNELRQATGKARIHTAHELVLCDVERAFSRDESWVKLGWKIDSEVFITELATLRQIRNKYAHYRADKLWEDADSKQLTGFLEWIDELASECL
ncbi:CBS domain-containing protein [Microbispora sp. NPDC046973]|uniref:CBS domain-containing protein n=1 Tax=unclassified Microbispora TaxID=2614687 RepID=UPI0015FEECA1|nr:CBS domain-containing protein [Microbispora sp. H10885]GLW26294.1 hypothetical protein Mame01_63360 [Microbispora amethystogenes]